MNWVERLGFAACFAGALLCSPGNASAKEKNSEYRYIESACPIDTSRMGIKNVQCGYLTVPENRSTPNSRSIQLAVAVLKASGSKKKNTPVVILNGGPGSSTIVPFFFRMAKVLFPGRDVVIVDQRGVGYSKPSLCPWVDNTADVISAMDLSEQEAELTKQIVVRACHDSLLAKGVDLNAYNVIENAADINDLRQALGYKKWNLVGGSYGGKLEQVEIRDYPSGVRSAVLVSPVPVDMLGGENVDSFARSLKAVFRLCGADSACDHAYPHLERTFNAAIAMLRRRPLTVLLHKGTSHQIQFVFNSQDFVHLVFEMLYTERGLADFPYVVRAFARRDSAAINRIPEASEIFESQMKPDYQLSYGMFYSDVCFDAPFPKAKWNAEAAAHPELKSIGFWNSPCSYWESAKATPKQLRPLHSNVPVLVINGGLDPIMPPEYVQRVLAGFEHPQHVFLKYGTHSEPSRRTVGCLRLLISQFLDDPPAELDTRCIAKLRLLTFRMPNNRPSNGA